MILRLLAGAGMTSFSKLLAEAFLFEVDRLADRNAPRRTGAQARVWERRYRANATITLLSIPLVSRADVGSGYTLIEQTSGPAGNTVAIQFGAGSYPGRAHGLNRLGYIQEVLVEKSTGSLAECAYFAFMPPQQNLWADSGSGSRPKL
jgi:hypothetical protein